MAMEGEEQSKERANAEDAKTAREAAETSEVISVATGRAHAFRGAVMATTAYATILAVTHDAETTEDLVDLCHSVCTFVSAARCSISGMVEAVRAVARGGGEHRLLPNKEGRETPVLLASASARAAAAMVWRSMGYFWADFLYVLVARACGFRPHQWVERLAHHALQSVGNLTCLLPGAVPQMRARIIAQAYLAEGSSIPLRLSSLLARRVRNGTSAGFPVLQRGLHAATLTSFAMFRLVNFLWIARILLSGKFLLDPGKWRLQFWFGWSVYAMNAAWFSMLLRKGMRRR